MSKEWKPNTRAYIDRWLDEAAESGEIDRRAKRLGISYGDAAVSLAAELEKPYREIEERAGRGPHAPDEEEIDRRARSYADREGVPYTIALDAVIGTTPGAKRTVELEEAPLTVDTEDADLNRKAEAHAAKHNLAYEVALEAVLTEGDNHADQDRREHRRYPRSRGRRAHPPAR